MDDELIDDEEMDEEELEIELLLLLELDELEMDEEIDELELLDDSDPSSIKRKSYPPLGPLQPIPELAL